MPNEIIELSIPFTSLLDSVSRLSLKEKQKLWGLLEAQIAQTDEELLEQDPKIRAEIRAARDAYKSGDSITVDEYIVKKRNKPR